MTNLAPFVLRDNGIDILKTRHSDPDTTWVWFQNVPKAPPDFVVSMLNQAYQLGYEDAQRDIQIALGLRT
jgi:hypothetical protein